MSDFGNDPVLVPDLPEPITGYRMWHVEEEGLVLQGRSPWMPGEDEKAECHRSVRYPSTSTRGYYLGGARENWDLPCGQCPSPSGEDHMGHGCGIYAYKVYADLARYEGGVFGEVQMWGTVYEHTAGYRSEFARIVRLFRTEAVPDEVLERIAAIYDVPLEDPPIDSTELLRERARAVARDWHQRQAQRNETERARRQIEGATSSDYRRALAPLRDQLSFVGETGPELVATRKPKRSRWLGALHIFGLLWCSTWFVLSLTVLTAVYAPLHAAIGGFNGWQLWRWWRG